MDADNPKAYLGDGVYAEYRRGHIWIHTSNGMEHGPEIALDDRTIDALIMFAKRMGLQ